MPIGKKDGGNQTTFSDAEFKEFESHFRGGSAMTVLCMFGWILNELSNFWF